MDGEPHDAVRLAVPVRGGSTREGARRNPPPRTPRRITLPSSCVELRSTEVANPPYSSAIIGAADRRDIALHRTRQVLLRARMHHPLEMVAVDPVERQRHQRRRDGANALFGKRDT